MTIEHSLLTGSSLHEPKGVGSASANTVYVADGLGSGTWTTLSQSSLASTAKAFQAQLLHVRDQVTSGTAGQSLTASTWNTHRLQTVTTNEITSASLTSNQISLPAGTYYLDGTSCHAPNGSVSKLRLRNITAGTTLVLGKAVQLHSSSAGQSSIVFDCKGRFTLGVTSTIEFQQYTNGASTGGNAMSSGEDEVYADVMIWKVG